MNSTPELVRRFNEAEAIGRSWQRKRLRRRIAGLSLPELEEVQDEMDWREAVRENREVRCIGISLP